MIVKTVMMVRKMTTLILITNMIEMMRMNLTSINLLLILTATSNVATALQMRLNYSTGKC